MKEHNRKIITLAALTTIAAGIIHVANRCIAASSQIKNLLPATENQYYDWRFGKIFYTKRGSGSPILLIHDTITGSSGYEWSLTADHLAEEHTVYTIDLLGCGRSDKPGITYTNFLFVQLLCDFTKNVIKEKTDVIACGFSCSFITMACRYDNTCFNKIIFVNPPSINSLKQYPSEKNKLFKYLIEFPVFGTLIYHMIVSRETISNLFIDNLYFNPFHVDDRTIDAYYESAHKGGYYAKYMYSSQKSKYMNIDISKSIQEMDNSIYILTGEAEYKRESIVDEYMQLNQSIETSVIEKSKHFPHMENVSGFLNAVSDYLIQ